MRLRDHIRTFLHTDSPLGDLARAAERDPNFPEGPPSVMRRHLETANAPDSLLHTFEDARDAWEREHGAHGLASGARVWWS